MRATKAEKKIMAAALLMDIYKTVGGEDAYLRAVKPRATLLRRLNLDPKGLVQAAVAAGEVLTHGSSMRDDVNEPMVFPFVDSYLTWSGDHGYAEAVKDEIVAENARRVARGQRPILAPGYDDHQPGEVGDDDDKLLTFNRLRIPVESNVIDFVKYRSEALRKRERRKPRQNRPST